MTRIAPTFANLRENKRKALIPFVCGGHPSLDATPNILKALDGAGAEIIEVGFPFTDPIADGPVIAAAMHSVLQAGATPSRILSEIADVRTRIDAALVAMVSVSIVQRIGPARFAMQLADAGFDAVVLPDVPLEEAATLIEPFRAQGLTFTLLIAPTTPPDRAAQIARACTGFVYLLARVGITGDARPLPGGSAPETDPDSLATRVSAIRAVTDLPIACGFGISTPQDVAAIVGTAGADADAAIVGSALVRELARAGSAGDDPARAAGTFYARLRTGL